VGVRPTIDESIKANLEVHLLDREIELYGQHIEVTFRRKLRDEKKFGSLEELKTNIARDIENTQTWFREN
jgi:riboflavin kinase/FMN adenylyltransferase